MMKNLAAAFFVMVAIQSTAARADDDCRVPMNQWQPREAVQTMATSRGWALTRIKIDDGCYEIRGTDETARAFKAKLDPATLAIVKFRHVDRDEHHDAEHDRDRKTNASRTDGVPSNALFKTDSRMEVVVK